MALTRYAQTTFTSGEFSPLLKGQTGFERYYSAVDELLNCEILPQGPIDRRGGMEQCGLANSANAGDTRLIEFVASEDDAMIIEIDTDNIRFWKDGAQIESGGSPYELTSFLSSQAEIFELDYEQEGNTIYLTHPSYFPRTLRRVADDEWELEQAPFVTQPFVEDYIAPATTLTLSATSGTSVTATAGSASFLAGDVYRFIRVGSGYGVITAFTSTTVVTISVLSDFSATSYASGEWEVFGGSFNATLTFSAISGDPIYGRTATLTASANCFRSADVGKYIRIHDGIVRITTFTSATVVNVVLVTALSAKTDTESWTLNTPAWVTAGDYPACVTFHEGRLVFAGASDTSANRNRIFASRTGDYTRMDVGADDSNGLQLTLGGRSNQIRWVESARDLMIGTVGDERSISGVQGPLTPSGAAAVTRTRWGSAKVKPVLIDNEVVYVQRSRKVIRNSVFSFQEDTYTSDELSFFSEHITSVGIKEMALQEDPRTVVWMPMDDGTLTSMAYKPEQNVLGLAPHTTAYGAYQAVIESVAVIPGTDGDEVWLAVRRQTGASSYTKVIERINSDTRNAYLDSWQKFTSGSPTATVTGVPSWMEGLTVQVLADGATHPDVVVSGAELALDRTASTVYYGFKFTSRVVPLEPETQGQGNTQGLPKKATKTYIRVYDSGPMKINGDYVPFRDASMEMGAAPGRKTGDVKSDAGAQWEDQAKLTIETDLPLPLTIVMLSFHLDTGNKQ